MKSNYRILSVLLLLALLAGCAPGPQLPPDDHIVVLWHTFAGVEREALETISDQFNRANPWGIQLIIEYQEDIYTKVRAVAPEHRPDLVVIWSEDLHRYEAAELLPATDALPRDVSLETADLLPMATALYSSTGALRGIPLGLATYLLYYNSDWLGGLGYDAANTDWNGLRRVACTSTDPLVGQVGLGIPPQPGVLLAILAAGEAPLVNEAGDYTFANPAGVAATTALHELLGSACGAIYPTPAASLLGLQNAHQSMLLESSLQRQTIQTALQEGRSFTLQIAPIPGPHGPGPTLWYGPGVIQLEGSATRREAARRALSWFLTPEAQTTWSNTTHYLPARASLITERLADPDLELVEVELLTLTLRAAERGYWRAWPLRTNATTCRAAFIQALLALGRNRLPDAVLEATLHSCTTGELP